MTSSVNTTEIASLIHYRSTPTASCTFLFLALLVFSLSRLNLDVANYLFPINVVLHIWVLYRLYKRRLLCHFDSIFVCLFPFYYLFSFLLSFYFSIAVLPEALSSSREVFLYCFSMWLMSVAFFFLRPKRNWSNIRRDAQNLQIRLAEEKTSLFTLYALSLVISIFFLSKIQFLSMDQLATLSRVELTSLVSQTGWFLKYVIIAYSWYIGSLILLQHRRSYTKAVILLLPVLVYWLSLISIGSRREIFFTVSAFAVLFFVRSDGRLSFKAFLFGTVAAIALLLLGVIRSLDGTDTITFITNGLGEFLFPISTLAYYFEHLQYSSFGESFVQAFYNFVPKELIAEKPIPLASRIAIEIAGNSDGPIMGYAFTPATEAYFNFGTIGVFIYPALLSFFSFFAEELAKGRFLLTMAILAQTINFQRSDFPSFIFEATLVSGSLFICIFMARIEYLIVSKPSKSKSANREEDVSI